MMMDESLRTTDMEFLMLFSSLIAYNHRGFTRGEIPYHVGSYWGIYIEEK